MITLLLLPFVLASRVSVDVSDWHYGPEYTYLVNVNVGEIGPASSSGRNGSPARALQLSSTLKCRPRVPHALVCRFDATRMDVFEEGLDGLGLDIVDNWDMDEEPFEVEFDRHGVRALVVASTTKPWIVDSIRAIVGQLSFGLDPADLPDAPFEAMERSYVGVCRSDVLASTRVWNEEGGWRDDKFEIVPMGGFRKASGEVVEIVKTRHLSDCVGQLGDYYFRYRNVPNVHTTLRASVSRIVVSDSNFTSYTANVVIVDKKLTNREIPLYEHVKVSLESVTASKTDVPIVPHPVTVDFFFHKNVATNCTTDEEHCHALVAEPKPKGKFIW